MKARLYFDVEFNGHKTDAEGMAAAMDRVVETGMSALSDCWKAYGGTPKVSECFVLDTVRAAEHAEALDLLIDGRAQDELGEMLAHVRDFLRPVAGEK